MRITTALNQPYLPIIGQRHEETIAIQKYRTWESPHRACYFFFCPQTTVKRIKLFYTLNYCLCSYSSLNQLIMCVLSHVGVKGRLLNVLNELSLDDFVLVNRGICSVAWNVTISCDLRLNPSGIKTIRLLSKNSAEMRFIWFTLR